MHSKNRIAFLFSFCGGKKKKDIHNVLCCDMVIWVEVHQLAWFILEGGKAWLVHHLESCYIQKDTYLGR